MTRALARYWTLLRRAAAGHRVQAHLVDPAAARPPRPIRPPGTGSWRGLAALHHDGRTGPPFPWAAVAAHDLDALARGAALRVLDRWTEARRWFAHLAPA